MVEIEIPVKLYIKRYLNVKYGKPAQLTRKEMEGRFLYELIEDPRQDRDKEVGTFNHTLTVLLPDRVLMKKGHYLTPTQISNFNSFMKLFIRNEMRSHIDLILRKQPQTEIKDAIYDYQQHYKLFDDFFPFDSIKKDYYRYRKSNNGQLRL